MSVDPEIVRAIAEELSLEQIKAARLAAVQAAVKGPHVQMTSSSFQDQSSAGVFVDRNPAEVIALCNAALDYLGEDADEMRANPKINHLDMRGQVAGW
jgi:hypothetical protein